MKKYLKVKIITVLYEVMYTFVFYIYLYFIVYLFRVMTSKPPNLFIEKIPALSEDIFYMFHLKILTRDVDALYNFVNEIPSRLEGIKFRQQDKYTMCFIETPHDATEELCELALEHKDLNDVKYHLNKELIE